MSDYIPFEIQAEIIKRLPVKSVVQCSWRKDVKDEKIAVLWNPSVGKAIDGFIYWRAYANINLADGIKSHFIISFNSKSDEFGKVCLPAGRLVRTNKFTISKVYESLGLFEYYKEGEKRFCDVWIMKEGATKSFTKMLSIEAPDRWMSYRVLELRKNGEAIIENIDDTITNYSSVLEVYDPSSGRRISGLGINGYPYSFSMNSYMETLLLLDQSNSIIK
ncbi:molybdate-anion transporter [Tanacetum coccineum]